MVRPNINQCDHSQFIGIHTNRSNMTWDEITDTEPLGKRFIGDEVIYICPDCGAYLSYETSVQGYACKECGYGWSDDETI